MPLSAPILASATATADQRQRPAWLPASVARRLDPLTALACVAIDRLPDNGKIQPDAAIVVGTAWGCTASTQRLGDDIAAHGDAGGSPSAFTSSVHQHLCGTLGELLHVHGPALTVSVGGMSGLSALRQAALLLNSGRASQVLVVVADLATPWWAATVAASSGCRHPVGGGAAALLLGSGPAPWRLDFSNDLSPQPLSVDAGGTNHHEDLALAKRAGPRRICAVERFGQFWPTAALAAAPFDGAESFTVHETESGLRLMANVIRL